MKVILMLLTLTCGYVVIGEEVHIDENAVPVENSTQTPVTHSPNSSQTPISDHTEGEGQQPDHHGDSGGQHDNGGAHKAKEIHVVEFNFSHVKTPVVFGLVVIIAALSKIGFHHADFLSSKVPESCILIILGVIFGAIVFVTGAGENIEFFEPDQFFLYLLPPIILEAAFSLHDRTFTDNLGSIIIFSVVGTVIACFTIGLSLYGLARAGAMADPGASLVQLLVFSALIVAVDPVAVLAIFQEVGVNNMLYFLVFGESLLNDGVTVVLYNVMQTFNRMDSIEADQIVLGIVKFFVVVIGGIFFGMLLGLLSAFLTKFTNTVKVVEPIIIFGFAYESYILAEMFHFSGIISIITCGLVQMQYAFNNITNKSKLACKFFAKCVSNTCEIIIFLFLGLKTVTPNHSWNTGFVLWTLLLCIVYRFLIVFVISYLINKCDTYRVRKIKLDEMFIISYGGLRGAVCFSLVALIDRSEFAMKDMFMTATLFMIFFTVFVQGGTIKLLVRKLRVSLQQKHKDMIMYQELNQHISDHMMAGIEEIIGRSGKYYLREKFDYWDDRYFRPLLLRDPKKCEVSEMNQYYEKLMMKEHYKNLRLCGATKLPKVKSNLREIDSSACLRIMGDEFEHRQLERDEKIQDRRLRLVSQRSMKEAETPEGLDLRRLLRKALVNSKNQAGLHYHDKNFVGDERRHLVSNLRNKYRLNQRLSSVSPSLQRALSVDEDRLEDVQRRASGTKLNLRQGRAHTVDLSPVDALPTSPEKSRITFQLDDTVFEEDEDDTEKPAEGKPLLDSHFTNKVNVIAREPETKRVLSMPSQKSDPGEEAKTESTENDLKHCDEKTEDNDDKSTSDSDSSDGDSRNGGPHRRASHHQGHLSRQNAMNDPDTNVDPLSSVVIQMQDLTEEKDKKGRKERKKSL